MFLDAIVDMFINREYEQVWNIIMYVWKLRLCITWFRVHSEGTTVIMIFYRVDQIISRSVMQLIF